VKRFVVMYICKIRPSQVYLFSKKYAILCHNSNTLHNIQISTLFHTTRINCQKIVYKANTVFGV